MTIDNVLSLFVAIVILAFLPSVSVLAVSIRSLSYGFIHGVLTTLGIVLGDIIFILIAIYGLSFLSETIDNFLWIIKFLAGVYLIYLGIRLFISKPENITLRENNQSSLFASFIMGFLITLGDLKAIFFYLSFLPAFVNLSTISLKDTLIIIATTIVGVSTAKLTYALMGEKTSHLFRQSDIRKVINLIVSILMIAIGLFLTIPH